MAGKSFFRGLIASIAFAGVAASAAQAQLTHLWHYEGQVSGSNWRSVAVGASGSQIVSNPNGGSGAVALLAGSEVPTSPLIWADNASASARTGLVRAAADSDAYASLYFENVSSSAGSHFTPKLTLRRSSSPTAVWTKTFNPITAVPESLAASVHVAASGARIFAWWWDISLARCFFVSYSDAGALNFAVSVAMPIPPQASAANIDASRLFVVCSTTTLVLDGATGAIVKTIGSWYSPSAAFAIDQSGNCAVIGNSSGAVDVYRTGTTLLAGAYTVPAIGTQSPRKAALSSDGTTLVVGYRSSENLFSWTIRVFTLGVSSATQVYESTLVGSGAFTTLITDIVESSSGDTIAVSTSGDELHTVPSLLVLKRNGAGYSLVSTHTLPGSVYDLDISPNGRLLAVASSLAHYQASTQTGVVDAFDLGGDLSVNGIPHAGTSVVVEQECTVGLPCVLLVSDALATSPIVYPGMGSLLLATPVRLATAIAEADGVARFNFTLPNSVASYGHTYYTQGLSLIQRKLTTSYAPITVVP